MVPPATPWGRIAARARTAPPPRFFFFCIFVNTANANCLPRYRGHLERLRATAPPGLLPPAGNDTPLEQLPGELKMRAVGQVHLLKATTGADVMALLLSSERVYSDMLDWCVRVQRVVRRTLRLPRPGVRVLLLLLA